MRQAKLKTGRAADTAMRASAALMDVKVASGVTDMRVLLDELVQESLRQGLAYMMAPIEAADPTFDRKWAIKSSIMATALNVQTKVDELQLKREREGGYDALMRQVNLELERRRSQADALDRSEPRPALEHSPLDIEETPLGLEE
jgi:hypothetical protein